MQKIVHLGLLGLIALFSLGFAYDRGLFDSKIKGPSRVEASKMVCDNPPTAERQITLPADGNTYHTSLFLPRNWRQRQDCVDLVAWFESDSQLRSLKSQTHFHVYEEGSVWYRDRYSRMVPTVPAVIVQKPDGQFMYESGCTRPIPRSAGALAADIKGNLFANCPNRPRPSPQPEPTPLTPNGPPVLEPGPSPVSDTPFLLIALGLAAGLFGGVATAYYEQYYKSA